MVCPIIVAAGPISGASAHLTKLGIPSQCRFEVSEIGHCGPGADASHGIAGPPALERRDFSPASLQSFECCRRSLNRQRCLPMKTTERVRQVVAGVVSESEIKEQTQKGWKLVALEWEREVEATEEKLPVEVPFGLRVSPDTQRLEEDPDERETLVQMMELIVQEGSYSKIAQEL